MAKTLLVLGGSSDMGMALIADSLDEYDLVLATYRTMSDKLEALAASAPTKIKCLKADLAVEEEVNSLIAQIDEMGIVPTHIVQMAAPPCENSKFHKICWEVFQNEIDISLKSTVLVLGHFLPKMAKVKCGRVVLMLSYVVNGAAPAYCANYVVTKYALLGLVKSLATEYASKGITVNGVSPAWVMTKYIDNQPHLLVEQNAADSPIGRNLETGDVVPTIRYLLSDGTGCVNGENIVISCGR